MDTFYYSTIQVMPCFSRKYFNTDDAAAFAVFHPQARIFYVARFVAKYRAQEPLLRRKLRLTLWGNFADQNIARAHFGARADNAVFVEITEFRFGYVGNVVGSFLGAEFCVSYIADELFYMNRGEFGIFDHPLGYDDGIFVVGTRPAHKRHERILPKRQL